MAAVSHQSPMDESIILKPYTYIFNPTRVTMLSEYIRNMNTIIKAPQEAVDVITEVWYTLERSLVLTDDIIDDSKFRFKTPPAHAVFGVPHTISTSWYAMFMAAEKLLALKQPEAMEILVRNMKDIYEAQTRELIWRFSFQCPTEEEFYELTMKKCGGFLYILTEFLQLFVQDPPDLTKLNKLLAFYYEAVDDVDDLQPGHVESYYEDINEGKFGFPLVIAINRHPGKLDKCDIAAGMADKTSRGSYIQSLLKESDALVCCEEILSELAAEIREEFTALGASGIVDTMLKFRF